MVNGLSGDEYNDASSVTLVTASPADSDSLVKMGAAAFPIIVGIAVNVGVSVGADVALIVVALMLVLTVSVQPAKAKKITNMAKQDKTFTIFVILFLG